MQIGFPPRKDERNDHVMAGENKMRVCVLVVNSKAGLSLTIPSCF